MARFTRRTALKGLTAGAFAPLLPACGGRAPRPSTVTPQLLRDRIDTVVVLMLENRSFDHVFGALSLEEGRTDVDGLTLQMTNPRADGSLVSPSRADVDCVLDPPHGWDASHRQWNDGRNDGFVLEHEARHGPAEGHRAMSYYDRAGLPVFYALADEYALCQRWFCSVMGPTWPNRFYALAATSTGLQRNEFPSIEYPTILDRVDLARHLSLTWGDYYGNVPFAGLLPRRLLDDPEYMPLERFFDDAAAGALPNLTLVEPIYGKNSDHPPEHPLAGQILVASIYEALARSPQWSRCLFVVTYDEHGGFFDHVPPPTTADDHAELGFDRLGFRVPTLVMGPWVKQGHVSDVVFDHTSTLAFLERMWELEPLTARDAAANDLSVLLDEQRLFDDRPAKPITLPVVEADPAVIYSEQCAGLNILHRTAEQAAGVTGQPELDAFYDARFRGHPKDRRGQSEAVHQRLLDVAVELGVARRRG